MHTHFLKDQNAGGPELLGPYARDAQVKPYLAHQNLGELITAEHKVLIETCGSGHKSPIRYRGAKFGSLKIRDETKLLGADMESIPWNLAVICEVDHGNIEMSKSTLHRSKKIWDSGMLNCGMLNRGRNLCVTVANDNSTVDGFHDELQLSAKKTQRKGASTNQLSQRVLFGSLKWKTTSVLRLTF